MERIKALKSGIENSLPLSDADKSYIRKKYEEITSKKLSTKSGCRDCWHDAVIEIIHFGNKKVKMYNGDIIFVDGVWYGNHNITKEIADKHLKEYPQDKNRFL